MYVCVCVSLPLTKWAMLADKFIELQIVHLKSRINNAYFTYY